jgi:hypothetical protein
MKRLLKNSTNSVCRNCRNFGWPQLTLAAVLTLTFGAVWGNAQTIGDLNPAQNFWQIVDRTDSDRTFWERALPKTKGKEQDIWQPVSHTELAAKSEGIPNDFSAFRLSRNSLASILAQAPHESRTPLGKSEIELKLPYPDGTLHTFHIQEAPVLEPSLAEMFPEIKSYRAISIDDPGTTARFDLSPRGFYATILAPNKTMSILPADENDDTLYASYDGDSLPARDNENLSCSLDATHRLDAGNVDALKKAMAPVTGVPINRKLKTYRIAVAATYAYYNDPNLGGQSYANTVASINTWINGVNAIFERDLSIRLLVVAPSSIIEQVQANDPYQDPVDPQVPPGGVNFPIVTKTLRDRVGIANYNMGHLFRANWGGGVGGLNSVCDNTEYPNEGPRKGAGETGFKNASNGNLGSLKVLAHELGHQFGADHTLNGLACAGESNTTPPYGNRAANSAYEVGSGTTIMSYNGVCGADNVVGEADTALRFHARSFEQITDHVYNGVGSTCGEFVDVSNSPPVIDQLEPYTIPKNTPFALRANAIDPDLGDNNNLTYTWEQYQSGGAWTQAGPNYAQEFGSESTYNDAADSINSTRPIFRPMSATTNPTRTFPSLQYILNNANDPPHKEGGTRNWIIGEELPRIARTLNFRVTARDTLGGVANKDVSLTVAGGAGPFRVSAPNTQVTWTGGSTQTIAWDVAGTDSNGVNTTSVKILLSTDGGQTFPIVLSSGVPNIGTANITLPNNINTTTARIKIQPTENIFFDISDTNFTITPPAGSCPVVSDTFPKVGNVGATVTITGANFTGVTSVIFAGNIPATTFTVNSNTQITATVPAGAQGGEIKVTKAGCGDAASGRFTLCSGTAVPASLVDDGSLEVNGFAAEGLNYNVNRVTPTSYPATLSEVRIYHSNSGFPTSKTINIVTAANPGGGENISNATFNTLATTVRVHNQFVIYKVDPITINSGDFIVGYSYVRGASESAFPVAVDQRAASNPFPNPLDPAHFKKRSYFSRNGIDFSAESDKNYMIRATAFSGTPTTISVSDDSIEFGGGASTGTNYVVNRITPAAYPATLSEVRIFHPSAGGFPVGKAITVLSAAHSGGTANIDNTRFNTRAATITGQSAYVSYQIDPITIHQGDFIVGYSFERTPAEPSSPIALDGTAPFRNRSYQSGNGTNFGTALTAANFMVRGAMLSSPCSNGACTYSVAMTNGPISGTGGSGSISVITQAGCEWKAARNVSWIRMLSLGNLFEEVIMATGSGTATFAVDPNPSGSPRTGGITVFGRVITIPQNLTGFQPEGEDPGEPEIYEVQATPLIEQQAALVPTAAGVNVGGRVTDAAGRSLKDVVVTISGQNGVSRAARTNQLGYYAFTEVPAGVSYIFTLQSKGHQFTSTPMVLNISDEADDINFVADN